MRAPKKNDAALHGYLEIHFFGGTAVLAGSEFRALQFRGVLIIFEVVVMQLWFRFLNRDHASSTHSILI